MAEVIWAPGALDDIDAIAEYISRGSVYHAALFVDRLLYAAERLKKHPYSGRKIPEVINELCREIIYGSYRIMYRLEEDNIWITADIHCAKNWKPPT
jgi:toxin ParE1/3/4